MRINNVITPVSSFLSVEKDTSIIMSELLKNQRLKKLLFYNTKDALHRPDLTTEQTVMLPGNHIKILPKIVVDKTLQTYLIVKFNTFRPNVRNSEFRDNIIEFDIVCHFDQWTLEDFQQRAFRIAAEIDTMFNKKHLTGIGVLQFVAGDPFVLTDEFGGFCLRYKTIHGEEDKTPMPTPEQEQLLMDTYYPGLEF